MALTYTPENELGTQCPDFRLKGMDEKFHQLSDFSDQKPLLVLFICNHCPYVKAIEDRLIQLGHDFKNQGIHMVAICSNESSKYTEDSFENLQKRYFEKKYPFIYLHDETQKVAKTFGAVCMQDYFLYYRNLQLAYRGRLDDNWKSPEHVTKRELYEAALKLKNGEILSTTQTPSMGCSIKWKN